MQFNKSWTASSPQSRAKTLIFPLISLHMSARGHGVTGSGLDFRLKSQLRSPPGMLVFTPDNLQASTGPISLAGVEPVERVKED